MEGVAGLPQARHCPRDPAPDDLLYVVADWHVELEGVEATAMH